jgi:hypothetical protein
MKENLILRKICIEGPTFYALKRLCHQKINKILYVCVNSSKLSIKE